MLCEYGCGQEAVYHLRSGKWCCSEDWQSCVLRKKYQGRPLTQETRKKMSISHIGKTAGENNSNFGRFGDKHFKWKGNEASVQAGNKRAKILFPVLGKCELCDNLAIDRHHKDGNTLNNNPSNVQFLCRSDHMKEEQKLKEKDNE